MAPASSLVPKQSGILTPINAPIRGYQPYSSIRAKKRAEFNAKRDDIAQQKLEVTKQKQEVRIKQLHEELRKLRRGL